ncbi:MAG: hypothetical protein HY303_05055, partial [Candidatus Wallbacteria bacterium]|nr:hypothetical protein [Candidatus Wallbacteria bacterium]
HPNDVASVRDPEDRVALDGTASTGTIEQPWDSDAFFFDSRNGAHSYNIRVRCSEQRLVFAYLFEPGGGFIGFASSADGSVLLQQELSGASAAYKLLFYFPDDLPGTYALTVVTEPAGDADLVAENPGPVPAAVSPGERVVLPGRIANRGQTTARRSVAAWDLVPLGDPLSAWRLTTVEVPDLAPGATVGVTSPVTLYDFQPAGTCVFRLTADIYGDVAESNESNNATTSPTLTQVVVHPNLRPEGSLSLPTDVAPGAVLSLDSGVSNYANVSVGTTSVAALYLSTSLSPGVTGELALATQTVGALADYSREYLHWDVTIPADLPMGQYYLHTRVDVLNQVQELYEADNDLAEPILVFRLDPDALEPNETPESAAALVPGTYPLTLTPGDSDFFRFSAPKDSLIRVQCGVEDRQLPYTISGPLTVLSSYRGTDTTRSIVFSAPATGEYLIAIQPGYGFTGAYRLTLQLKPPSDGRPNLVAAAISMTPTTCSKGDALLVTAVVRYECPGAVQIPLYWGASIGISSNRELTGGMYLSGRGFGETMPGTQELRDTVWLPSLPPGTYYVGVRTFGPRGLAESNSADNQALTTLTVTAPPAPSDAPDLVVSDFSYSGGLVAERPVELQLRATVANRGLTTAGPSSLRFVASPNSTIGPVDNYIGQAEVGSLAPGEAVTVSAPGNLWWITTGVYTLGAYADIADSVTETDETNNTTAAAPVLIDDHPGTVDGVNDAFDGITIDGPSISARIDATVDVDYFSFHATGPATVSVEVTPVATLRPAIAIYGPDGITELARGPAFPPSGRLARATATLPGAGRYFVRIAGSKESVGAYRLGVVTTSVLLPDILVTQAYSPAVVIAGTPWVLEALVSNPGSVSVTQEFAIDFWLSDSPTAPTTVNILLGQGWPLSRLDARSQTGTHLYTSVPSLPPGAYFLRAVADSGDAIAEWDETNNQAVLPITVVQVLPDAFEPNDTAHEAWLLAPGTYALTLHPEDLDFFRFVAPAGSWVRVELEAPPGWAAPVVRAGDFRQRLDIGDYGIQAAQFTSPTTTEYGIDVNPSGAGVGSYTLRLQVKPPTQGRPNLSVGPMTLATSVVSRGQTVQAATVIRYDCPGALQLPLDLRLDYLVSSSAKLDEGQLLNSRIINRMAPGTRAVSDVLGLPQLPCGSYFIGTRIQPDPDVAESNFTDNTTAVTVYVPPGTAVPDAPDLSVSDVKVDGLNAANRHSLLYLTARVSNRGQSQSERFLLRFVLSESERIG